VCEEKANGPKRNEPVGDSGYRRRKHIDVLFDVVTVTPDPSELYRIGGPQAASLPQKGSA